MLITKLPCFTNFWFYPIRVEPAYMYLNPNLKCYTHNIYHQNNRKWFVFSMFRFVSNSFIVAMHQSDSVCVGGRGALSPPPPHQSTVMHRFVNVVEASPNVQTCALLLFVQGGGSHCNISATSNNSCHLITSVTDHTPYTTILFRYLCPWGFMSLFFSVHVHVLSRLTKL